MAIIIAIAVCHLAGIIGSLFTRPAISSWYVFIQKPFFSPPNWIFTPIWLLLYTLMGISLFLVWNEGFEKHDVKFAVYVFLGSLVLNSLWSIIFFGMKNILAAFFEICLLFFVLVFVFIRFYHIKKTAAYLLIPYILWVLFAGILNYSIFVLNI